VGGFDMGTHRLPRMCCALKRCLLLPPPRQSKVSPALIDLADTRWSELTRQGWRPYRLRTATDSGYVLLPQSKAENRL
jgi:hypothetical protein